VGQVSGAVGNYAHISPEVEMLTCEHLQLHPVNIATQVIQRDRHAEFCSTLAIIGSTLEKIALEVRHLQRTEVQEASEGFAPGQKGSSAMPHKKNPIISERICGLARILAFQRAGRIREQRPVARTRHQPFLGGTRDIAGLHYSAGLHAWQDHPAHRPAGRVPAEHAAQPRAHQRVVFSQPLLLMLAERGVPRDDAYRLVQRNAMTCWETKKSFRELVSADADIMARITRTISTAYSATTAIEGGGLLYQRVGL
jgi:adenylosuccinate lyase